MSIEKLNFISKSEAETGAFAEKLAQQVPLGSVIAMHGDLGAGKTVFARAFAKALGIKEKVSSPTYTIIQEYKLASGGYLYHLDLYRINSAASALDFAVDEYLNDPESYALVEWPERITELFPPQTFNLTITHIDNETRQITFE